MYVIVRLYKPHIALCGIYAVLPECNIKAFRTGRPVGQGVCVHTLQVFFYHLPVKAHFQRLAQYDGSAQTMPLLSYPHILTA